jgi:SAM-dependent methyltransferase
MPSVTENRARWSEHPWEREGHEWSPGQTAAGGEMLWWRSLRPRIAAHVPTGRILEIGPGFGRWTQHLLALGDHVTAVDVTERCIDHCRSRFAGSGRFDAWTNDGESLDRVADGSLDFVFSFDSLVHAEATVLRGYVHQLSRKLKPGGSGFIHHSNLKTFAREDGGLPAWLARRNWRAESMSAKLFREFCAEAGLVCGTQEIINWISRSRRADRHRIAGPGLPLTDVLSTFHKPDVGPAAPVPTRVYLNPGFAEEWRQLVVLASLYAGGPGEDAPTAPATTPMRRAARALKRQGLTVVLNRARQRANEGTEYATSLIREKALAARVRSREPIVNAIRRQCCPDCGARLDSGSLCRSCQAQFLV